MYNTYVHYFKESGDIFYVGMSKNESRVKSKQRQKRWWAAVEDKEWEGVIIKYWGSAQAAAEHEKRLIDELRAHGCKLVNMKTGGELDSIAGTMGGRSTSPAKQAAVRRNGMLGGRPPKRLGHTT